jgi:hypothetical protein
VTAKRPKPTKSPAEYWGKSLDPCDLWTRGQLASRLRVHASDIRYIPGILNEVGTTEGPRYRFRECFYTRADLTWLLKISRAATANLHKHYRFERGPGGVHLFYQRDFDELHKHGKPYGPPFQSEWIIKLPEVRASEKAQKLAQSVREESAQSTAQEDLPNRHDADLLARLRTHWSRWSEVNFRGQSALKSEIFEMLIQEIEGFGLDIDEALNEFGTSTFARELRERQRERRSFGLDDD